MKPFPPLRFDGKERNREFNYYNDEQKAAVIYHWLVDGMTTRELDDLVLKLGSSGRSKGFQSFSIYRYLGLDHTHQGFFKGWPISDIILYFHKLCLNPDYCVIFYYFIDYLDRKTLSPKELSIVNETMEYQPEDSLKNQTWIRNTWIRNDSTEKTDINTRLLELPDISSGKVGKVSISRNKIEYYSNTTVKETIKNLYDFHCQVCGELVLKTGWHADMSRIDSWRYLSADVHHILPLSEGGPDVKSNMVCLCPTCHRKFHSGEYRLKEKNDTIFVRDELLGKNMAPNLLHDIILY